MGLLWVGFLFCCSCFGLIVWVFVVFVVDVGLWFVGIVVLLIDLLFDLGLLAKLSFFVGVLIFSLACL